MLPAALIPRVRTSAFWNEFLFVDEDACSAWQPWKVVFPLEGCGATLALSADATGYLSLSFGVGESSFEVAWDDLAHWHPHLLRWAELDAISRVVAMSAPAYPHPGVPLLLLARFAPLVSEADGKWVLPLVADAWRMIGLSVAAAEARLIEIIDFRSAAVEWHQVPQLGWCVTQAEGHSGPRLYSLRMKHNAAFPWRQWYEFVERVETAGAKGERGGPTKS